MFTGVIDKDGEETVVELGGQLVDSVYHCTHLVTDKVEMVADYVVRVLEPLLLMTLEDRTKCS